jgi:hypothetical protein
LAVDFVCNATAESIQALDGQLANLQIVLSAQFFVSLASARNNDLSLLVSILDTSLVKFNFNTLHILHPAVGRNP